MDGVEVKNVDLEALKRDLEFNCEMPDWDASWVIEIVRNHLATTSRLNATVGDGWRPIESCPKIHGKRFLGYHFEIGHFVAEWFVDSFVYTWNQHDCPITHWMPLPAAPSDGAENA